MEIVIPLLLRSCADPKQLLFGVDDSYRRTVAYARDTLAHFPSERVWVDALGGLLAGDTPPYTRAEQSGALMAMARALDHVVGGHRFASCAALAPIRSAL